MEKRVFEELQYFVKEPGCSTKKNPAIIFLHGAGTRGEDMEILKRNTIFGQNSHISDCDSPFIVFAPLCGRNSWFDVFEQLQNFVRMVAVQPAVDHNQIYLVGISMGGYATWQLAMTMPEYFAAVVPICGGGMRWNVRRLMNVPVWAFHGKDDQVVPPIESVLMVEKLQEVGGNARLTLLEKTGHVCWDYAWENKELFDWMLKQRKSDTPIGKDTEFLGSAQYG